MVPTENQTSHIFLSHSLSLTKNLTILNYVNAEGSVKTSEENLEATEVVSLGLIKESVSLTWTYNKAVSTDAEAFTSSLEDPAKISDK